MPNASFEAPSFAPPARTFSSFPRISWGAFIILLLGAVVAALGEPMGVAFLALASAAILFALRFPYFGYYLFAATGLLLGWNVSLSTGAFRFGERAFRGSIDISIGELVAGAVLIAWAMRVLLLWRGRRDWNWRPWLPFFGWFSLIALAHLVSMFSPALPDKLLVFKYSLRPVMFAYVACVALTVNFVRSRRRLMAALGTVVFVGSVFAVVGFSSLFVFEGGAFSLHRARPLPVFGVNLLGGNHNSLAELLLFAIPAALAVGALTRSPRAYVYSGIASAFMFAIALLTFARSAWIALIIQTGLLLATVWRPWFKRNQRTFALILLALLPVAVYMARFSLEPTVKGSTEARAMLTSIAFDQFRDSPFVGVGAGTFVDRVSRIYAYAVEFGAPIEAHGVLQKLTAETGAFGLGAFAVFVFLLFRYAIRTWRAFKPRAPETMAYAYLFAAMTGAFVYQLFDTTYWTPRLWLPVGLFLASSRILLSRQSERDPNFLYA